MTPAARLLDHFSREIQAVIDHPQYSHTSRVDMRDVLLRTVDDLTKEDDDDVAT